MGIVHRESDRPLWFGEVMFDAAAALPDEDGGWQHWLQSNIPAPYLGAKWDRVVSWYKRLSGRPGDPRQYLLGHVHGTATEPMESGAPCPTTDGDPEGGTLYFEDGHKVTHAPALLWSLMGPGCRLAQRGRAGSENLYGACLTMSTALGGSPWSLERRVRLLK